MLLLSLAATPASAQSTVDRASIIERMGQADANRDGKVTKAELIAWRTASFTRFDRNGDNILSDADVPAMLRRTAMGSQLDMMKVQFDANRDGRVTRDEFVNGPTTMFNIADANQDNVLTRAEIQSAAQTQRAAR